jgi:hypothetical protein
MFKVKKLIDLVALKALISGVREHSLRKNLYALLDRSLLKVKQAMKNHIWVEEASMLRYGPPRFYQKVRMRNLSNGIVLLPKIIIPKNVRKSQ